ncbi:MAG TPA: hypothetical protein PL044_05290 [Clostridiales bacterium]|nr:hypothetical protein [Clostridiales bacterium]
MPIHFDKDRWAQVRENYVRWWKNELNRPIVALTIFDEYPDREQPSAPCLSQQSCADFSFSPDELIDRLDYELSALTFLGDSFPMVNLSCFGPGVEAAFLGAKLDNSRGAVWFYPPDNAPADISELHFEYDPNNRWFCRIKDICAAAVKRWKGNVLVGMPDVGMGLDLLASFRTTEQLLFDLVDSPNEVKRLLGELNGLWMKYYVEIDAVMQPYSPGYTDWAGIYSDKPFYTLQSDFSYMIGTPMFNEFTRPTIERLCQTLTRSVYHLDGISQLPHLDSLLAIKELDGVQWVPGDGRPDMRHWPEVYKKIHAAGKKIQIFGGLDTLDAVGAQIGDFSCICVKSDLGWCPDAGDVIRRLKEYGL